MDERLSSDWSEWTRDEWNRALFDHFFVADEDAPRPLTRLAVTRDELRDIAGASGTEALEVQEAFVDAARLSPGRFKDMLSAKHLDGANRWSSRSIPPFFFFLVFTCFVASPPDEEVIDKGNFRKRMRMLLGHPARTSYDLPDLATLWRAFEVWIDERILDGLPYRPLKLPEEDWRKRIGFSIQLAFPGRKDLLRLAQLLDDYESPDALPIRRVLRRIYEHKEDFSDRFCEELDDFRSKVRKGHLRSRMYDHPLWAAVREAVTLTVDSRSSVTRVAYQLVLEDGGHCNYVSLLASDAPDTNGGTHEFVPVEANVPGFEYRVERSEVAGGAEDPVRRLLSGTTPEGIPDLQYAPLCNAARQGILLFCLDEAGFWTLTPTLPDPVEAVRALVREDLRHSFLQEYGGIPRGEVGRSAYHGWLETPRFRGEILWKSRPRGRLASIRCLQRILSPPRIRLVEGVPVDDGYLGLPPLLPSVKIPEADSVTIVDRSGASDRRFRLVKEESGVFVIPGGDGQVFEGDYKVVARSGGEIVAQRTVTFRSRNVGWKYKRPTHPRVWIVEDSVVDCRRLHVDEPVADEIDADAIRDLRNILPGLPRTASSSKAPPSRYTPSAEEGRRIDRFVECCAAIASHRKGIREHEFLRLIEQVLGVEDYRLKWDVARSWMEAGCFDRLTQTTWRQSLYFARPPRLVLSEGRGEHEATLVGLAPESLRRGLDREAHDLGIRPVRRDVYAPWSPPVRSWAAQGRRPFETLCERCELPPPKDLTPLADVLHPVEEVVARSSTDAIAYEPHTSWSWDDGAFSQSPGASSDGVCIERLRRPDRPDLFTVSLDGRDLWHTRSRNWSLLLGYVVRGTAVLAPAGRQELVRAVQGQVYLPLPIARHLAVVGHAMPGPCRTSASDGWKYAYHCSSEATRRRVVGGLWHGLDREAIARRLRWITMLARRPPSTPTERQVRVPNDLLNRLDDVYLELGFRDLAAASLPPYAVPHLRKLVRDIERNAV